MGDISLIPESIRSEETIIFNDLLDRFDDIDLSPMLIYIIDLVHPSALPHLAEQFHITDKEGWKLAKTYDDKRRLIKNAIPLHRMKGKKKGPKFVLELLGLDGKIQLWNEYNGDPYHFKVGIDLVDRGIDEETYTDLEDLINEYKNARSILDSLTLYLTNRSKAPSFSTSITSGEEITVYPYSIRELNQNSKLYFAIGYQSVDTTTVYPLVI